jgi:HD-GYP domain-containing protein (c-di-GMP phosphodiesterase class II)
MAVPILRQRRGRILRSLILLLLMVGPVPLLMTSAMVVDRNREILEEDQRLLQIGKARSLSQQVAIYLGSLQAQVAAIARTLEVDTQPGQLPARLKRIREAKALERYVGGKSPLVYVSVVDVSGSGVRSGVQLPEIEGLLQEGFLRALQGERMASHPMVSESLKEPVMVISEPIAPDSGGVHGAVLSVASLGPLWTNAAEAGEAGLFEVYVVDGRGYLVAHSDPTKLAGDRNVSNVEIVRQFLSKGGAGATVLTPFTLAGADGQSTRMLGTYTRVPDESGWGVIVQVDEWKALYSATEMRTRALWLTGAVTILGLVLGAMFARQISRPIQELAGGARRLAEGDYGTRVKVRSGNEVGLLADAFNHMGERVQKAIEEVRRAAAVNKELFLGSIRMLANAIDEKDPYTRGHSERVAFYSMVIAKHLGMSAEECERVHLSGLIHDVGKIGIEDKILRKASALTDEEYAIMKQHPRKGDHILEAVPILKRMAGAGLMHHENWDGTGYPEGLKGPSIPLLGRIVCVADAFDAMTTDRPYSKAMTFEAAVARLRFLAGKKFDPASVEAMERAAAAGDLTPTKARRASIASRREESERVVAL